MEKDIRISNATAIAMIVVAALIDGIQALFDLVAVGLLANPLIDAGAAAIFGFWFSRYDINVISPRRSLPFAITILAEFIPGINALPIWTGYVAYTVIKSRLKKTV